MAKCLQFLKHVSTTVKINFQSFGNIHQSNNHYIYMKFQGPYEQPILIVNSQRHSLHTATNIFLGHQRSQAKFLFSELLKTEYVSFGK